MDIKRVQEARELLNLKYNNIRNRIVVIVPITDTSIFLKFTLSFKDCMESYQERESSHFNHSR